MTRYELGFMAKCAEYGVSEAVAARMLKMAQATNAVSNASSDDDLPEDMPDPMGPDEKPVPQTEGIPPGTPQWRPPVKPLPSPIVRRPTMTPEERARRVEEMRAENRRRNPNSLESILGRFYPGPSTNAVSTNAVSSAGR